MRYLALCCDYDGTLATHGRVTPEAVSALTRLKASGRRVILVTGRELPDLASVCPYLELFDAIVAENGALLYEPTGGETPLALPPPARFIAKLKERGVHPLSVGRVILATWAPHETAVLEVIRDEGLELQVIFNKGAVMVLPAGVSKATGLAAALQRLGISAHNTVGIGDAENDHALLAACECSAAVANALPALKSGADIVTREDHGAGVAELCEELLRDDLAAREPRLTRHHLLIGRDEAGHELRISPYGEQVLVLAEPGSSAPLLKGLATQLALKAYTFCAICPQARLGGAVILGEQERAPGVEEILEVLRTPAGESVLVNLHAVALAERAAFLSRLAPSLAQLRRASGRPHWLLIEDAEQLAGANQTVDASLEEAHTVLRTAQHPRLLGRRTLSATTLLVAIGAAPRESIEAFCRAAALPLPAMDQGMKTQALSWRAGSGERPRRLSLIA
jgi:hydroxymethylpyrimidine pyrophosphatase-like HAD family hydrolase